MNLLYILNEFPKISETFILDEIIELIKIGNNIEIFSLKKINLDAENIHDDFYKYNLDKHLYFFHKNKFTNEFNFFNEKTNSIFEKTDLIVSHFATQASLLSSILSKKIMTPFIFTAHAYDIFVNPNFQEIGEIIEKSKKCITISNYNKSYLQHNISNINKDKIIVLYNSIKKENYVKKIEKKDISFLTIGRLVPKKGIASSIYAYSIFKNKSSMNSKYNIIGDGPLLDELKLLVQELNLVDEIHFLGEQNRTEVKKKLKESDIFVLTSEIDNNGDREGIPVSILEAMSYSLPVISTKHSGIPELVKDNYTGFLVDEKNVLDIAKYMEKLAIDKELRLLLGLNGNEIVSRKFNLNDRTKLLNDIFLNSISTGSDILLKRIKINQSCLNEYINENKTLLDKYNEIFLEIERIKKSFFYRIYKVIKGIFRK